MEQINKRLLSWASMLEDQARRQAVATSTLPFIAPHVALMPDAHWGMGSTVGSVIPTEGVVMPAAVGVDIGCGMSATRTRLRASDLAGRDLGPLREAIEREVPVSMGKYRATLSETAKGRIDELERLAERQDVDPERYAGNWRHQLGSLGSGNHFIEVCLDEADRVWVFLHSGSRGVGNKIAMHHVKIAQRQCEKWYVPLPHKDLAYLPEGDDEFWAYIRDLRWAQAFAAANRAEMVDRVVGCLVEWYGGEVGAEETITCHHNYTERERHFGRDVWLTRKGAINAAEGVRGLIPGSMGTRSYVVTGKGNRPSFHSAPHGAGRNFSRTEARRRFTVDQLAEAMAGIEWRRDNANAFLDEIPGAYKDIDQVMEDARDLVTIDHELRQILNVKGD
ncbi:RtcB family protein [Pseudonocardia acaciae]|uniref:RtcB family protein n=1 Tax=Pseudonocardia acaciae TaxID=551276 RepID=UPI000491A738|nr:RtcB family protein [Pseudonocardia acaciae]